MSNAAVQQCYYGQNVKTLHSTTPCLFNQNSEVCFVTRTLIQGTHYATYIAGCAEYCDTSNDGLSSSDGVTVQIKTACCPNNNCNVESLLGSSSSTVNANKFFIFCLFSSFVYLFILLK